MKKVLVTGAGGFIGSHLCESLVKKGFNVRAMVRYNSGNHWGWLENLECKDDIEVVLADIRNYDSVKKTAKGVDLIFHLAALIGIPYSYQTPESYIDTNVKGTLNVLQAANEFQTGKIICVSTSEVYGTAQQVPISENHPMNPQSPYAASKAAADFMALSFYRSFGTPVGIVRLFNTYGPRQSARAIIPAIIIQLLSGSREIKLGLTDSTRDFTFVKDSVDGFIKAASANIVGKIINIGSNNEIKIKDLACLISRLSGRKISIVKQKERVRPDKSEVKRLVADTSKARKLFDWKAAYDLEDGLRQTIEWFSLPENLARYKAEIYNV